MERDAGVQVADAGMVDSPARALEAASLFAREQVDLVFLLWPPTVCRRRSCPSCSGSTVRCGAQPATDAGHRLRAAQRPGRPRPDDGHVAGELPGLFGARNRQRAGAQPPTVRLRDGMARRSGRLAADREWIAAAGVCAGCVGTGSAYWDTTTGGCSTYIPTSRASRPSSGRTSNCSKCASCTPCERR